MACHERETELRDWALGELSPEKERELEQHLAGCASCAHSAEELRKLRQALMSHLTDREMPSHLVFVGEERKPKSPLAAFWPSLARAAALSAAAAAIFLAIVSLGLARWRSQLLPAAAPGRAALNRAEITAIVNQAISEQTAVERSDMQAANQDLAAHLRQEQASSLAQLARQLDYLELAETTVWKETQRQSQVVDLIAHNSLEAPAGSPEGRSRR
jgi:anti-sigma factor RsiW